MKLKELVEKQSSNSIVSLYVDNQLSLSADIEYLKKTIQNGDIRGEYTLISFAPTVFNHISGDHIPHMEIHVKKRKVN